MSIDPGTNETAPPAAVQVIDLTPEAAERLWRLSETLTGVRLEA